LLKVAIFTAERSAEEISVSLLKSIEKVQIFKLYAASSDFLAKKFNCELIYDTSNLNAIGMVKSIQKALPIANYIRSVSERIKDINPDIIIFVDFGGTNVRLAKKLRSIGIKAPFIYFFPPGPWGKTQDEINNLAQPFDLFLVPYKFYLEAYKRTGKKTFLIRNPILDDESKIFPARSLSFGTGKINIGIFPGSRSQEVDWILPFVLDECMNKRNNFTFNIYPFGPLEKNIFKILISKKISVEEKTTKSVDAAIVTSGTMILRIIKENIPFVGVYRIHPWDFFFYKKKLERPNQVFIPPKYNDKRICFLLPNILLGENVFPEVLFPYEKLWDKVEYTIKNRDALLEASKNVISELNDESYHKDLGTLIFTNIKIRPQPLF
jgi:lipid-A-disaccharide synthase